MNVPVGWALVPRHATSKMLDAGHFAMPVEVSTVLIAGRLIVTPRKRVDCVSPQGVLDAMIAAAPPPPEDPIT